MCTGTVIIEGPSNVTYLPGLITLPIELTCIVTGVAAWSVNGMVYSLTSLTNGAVPGHNVTGTNILVYSPVNNTEYVCISQTNDSETRSVPAYINIITGEYVGTCWLIHLITKYLRLLYNITVCLCT